MEIVISFHSAYLFMKNILGLLQGFQLSIFCNSVLKVGKYPCKEQLFLHLLFEVNLVLSLTEVLVFLEQIEYSLVHEIYFCCTSVLAWKVQSGLLGCCLVVVLVHCICFNYRSKQAIQLIWGEQERSCQILSSEGLCFER